MKVNTEDELRELFDDILSQTFRIRNLLSRFSPVVNEKECMAEFHVVQEIEDVFQEFTSRLHKENVEWEVVKGKVVVRLEEEERLYKIIFEDNGVGIADEYLDKVFEPFFTTKDH